MYLINSYFYLTAHNGYRYPVKPGMTLFDV